MATPKKNVAYDLSIGLVNQLDNSAFVVNPTIAAGDFTISKDDGGFVNLANLPVVTPAGSQRVKIDLNAAEMNATRISILGVDAAGNQWNDILIEIDIPAFNELDFSLLNTLVEDYPADATPGNAAELLYLILANVSQFDIVGTNLTARKLDGSAIAAVYNLNDADNPSSRERTS